MEIIKDILKRVSCFIFIPYSIIKFIKPFLIDFVMARIAIEATGCDKGFSAVLDGARKVLDDNTLELKIVLVAGEDRLPEKYRGLNEIDGIALELAEYTYNSRDSKDKQFKSSIFRAAEMHKNREVEAVIDSGDTRGSIVAARRILGLMNNVLAPAIPSHWPRNNVLIDSGANIESTPENLMQSAIMGYVYSKYVLGVDSPLIGIISNGKERSKGNRFIRESRRLIKNRLVDYNLSDSYFEGDCVTELDGGQVRVTDGHSGNEILKTAEGCLITSFTILFGKVKQQNFFKRCAAKYALRDPLREMKQELNYETYAVGPLLGVDGNIMISHGKSSPEAIASAIRVTKEYLDRDINTKLGEEVEKYGVVEIV